CPVVPRPESDPNRGRSASPRRRAGRGLGSSLRINQGGKKMRKAILPVAIVVAIGVGFAVVNATAKDKPKGPGHGTIHVIEHATSDAVTNGSSTTDLAGNILTFANDVYDSADASKVGSDQG